MNFKIHFEQPQLNKEKNREEIEYQVLQKDALCEQGTLSVVRKGFSIKLKTLASDKKRSHTLKKDQIEKDARDFYVNLLVSDAAVKDKKLNEILKLLYQDHALPKPILFIAGKGYEVMLQKGFSSYMIKVKDSPEAKAFFEKLGFEVVIQE